MHPGRLVRGLARAVERLGATIHERTAVVEVEPGAGSGRVRPALRTQRGELRATSVVLAGEAYLTQLRPWHRTLLPTYSLIVLTEPLTDEQWATIGWRNRECLASYRLSIDYLTDRGRRILFGGRGALPVRIAHRAGLRHDARTHAMLRRFVTDWFRASPGSGSATPGAARSGFRVTGSRRSRMTRGPGSPPGAATVWGGHRQPGRAGAGRPDRRGETG
jgi:glycine/D-amino acid oxidase-like deaminating enzyme